MHHNWRLGNGRDVVPYEDEEVPGYADREPNSRVELDSLEPEYNRRNKDGLLTANTTSKPLPPPPPLSPPPPSCLSSDCTTARPQPPPPPPPPPKKFGKIVPVTRVSNGRSRKSRARTSRPLPDYNSAPTKGEYAWEMTSSMYWKLLVVLQVVFSIADLAHDGTIMLYYQRIFLMFLFCMAIAIIVCMYIYTMYTKSSPQVDIMSNPATRMNRPFTDAELGGSLSSTLKRALYIRKQALCRTNFHLRLGAVVFGIATLIYYGFEISVHTTNKRISCVDDVVYALPIVLVVLSFLQIHFLFVNSQVLVGSLRGPAQFCFAHMLATNLALWLKMIASQSAMKWVTFTSEYGATLQFQLTTNGSRIRSFYQERPNQQSFMCSGIMVPPEFQRIAVFANCLHNTTLGQMWLQATPFLVPFLLQFCVVSAAVFYVLWSSMSLSAKRIVHVDVSLCRKTSVATQCQMENKGIFVGLLLLVGGIVVLVMYLILRAEPQFVNDSLWVVSGTLCLVLAAAILSILIGFVKMQGVAYVRDAPRISHLDALLNSTTSAGPLLYSVLGLVATISHLDTNDDVLVMAHSGLLLIQVFLQNIFVAERWRRVPNRAGQQIIQVMLFANATLWLLDTFMTSSGDSQRLQEKFYGPVLFGILSYSSTPVTALYRFHSTIQFYELWKKNL